MSGQPDWMNFEDDALSSPPPAPSSTQTGGLAWANQDTSAPQNKKCTTTTPTSTPATSSYAAPPVDTSDEVPLFLREDKDALHRSDAAATTPAFLAAFPSESAQGHTKSRGVDSSTLDTAVTGESAAAVMYADQPAAANLTFTGDGGNSWDLYRVRILGKGNYGCATLYTLDTSPVNGEVEPTRAVVVKDINVQTMLNPAEDMAAVRTELHVLRRAVGHPNLVQYVDALFDTRPGNYPMCFILMEYAAGGDLSALLEKCTSAAAAAANLSDGPSPWSATSDGSASPALSSTSSDHRVIPESHVAAFFIQTAVALQSLHTEHGILHRDVKPHNIFLLEDGVTVRLGDFGIATQLGRVGDKAKEACGSPYFMAPEIFAETAYDAAADVWSLGVVFYQLVAHQLPFLASTVAALGGIVRRGQYTRLSTMSSATGGNTVVSAPAVAATYSQELRELIDSLLTVEAAARPTLRRVLRSRYVREHLHCVPVSVLTAPKKVGDEESLYASIFGAEAVAAAVAASTGAGVHPIVGRVPYA